MALRGSCSNFKENLIFKPKVLWLGSLTSKINKKINLRTKLLIKHLSNLSLSYLLKILCLRKPHLILLKLIALLMQTWRLTRQTSNKKCKTSNRESCHQYRSSKLLDLTSTSLLPPAFCPLWAPISEEFSWSTSHRRDWQGQMRARGYHSLPRWTPDSVNW
jgi:hypothetical protein